MENKYMLVLALASIAAAASIAGIHAVQVAHAQLTGNPHTGCDTTDDCGTNPQGKGIGNPHNTDEGVKSGNPHPPGN